MSQATKLADNRWRVRRLTRWFEKAARDLPWRRNRSAYTALVSELMLQQTQVGRVVERFDGFLRRFPTPCKLAAADEQDVLTAWQGLGYYRRARHLHRAAQVIVEKYDGETPTDAAALQNLPGVGRYTAGAIASIVGGAGEPIVDGNVRRVLARWHGEQMPTDSWCWDRATELVAAAKVPGVLNEAMMELGATVCTPANPRCDECPVKERCAALTSGQATAIPKPRPPARRSTVHHHCIVVTRGKHVLLEQRPATGLWAALWQPVTIESTHTQTQRQIEQQLPFRVSAMSDVATFTHQTTHRRIEFHVFTARTRIQRGVWQPFERLGDLPMSNPHRRMITEHAVSASR